MATTTFNDLITFSRGSNATLVGPNGLVQWAPANLLTNSQSFEAATSWVLNGVSAFGAGGSLVNTAAAPDGSTTADKLVATAANVRHEVYQPSLSVVAGQSYTFSFYAKAAEYTFVQAMFSVSGFTGNEFVNVNLTNGAVGTIGSGVTASSVTAVGNGWYRISMTAVAGTTTTSTTSADVVLANSASFARGGAFLGDGTSGILVWGAQLELGSTATAYNNTSVRNLLGFSEAFDNAAWTRNGASIVTGAQANPVNGLFNAQKLMEDTSTGVHRVYNTTGVTYVANTPLCFSFYAKSAGRSFTYVRLNNSGGDIVVGYVDLTTGAVSGASGGTVTATSVGNGWWRISAIGSSATATAVSGYIVLASSSSVSSYTGDGSSGVFIYGAQLSNSASLDAYVPTPGAAPSSTAYYGPRLDYDPVTLQPRGLLVEEARTNLLTYSEQFNDASWSKIGTASVTANTYVAPDGTTTGDTLSGATGDTAVTSTNTMERVPTVLSSTAYTFTIYVRSAGSTTVKLTLRDASTGAVQSVSATPTATWTRLTVSLTTGAATTQMNIRVGGTNGDIAIWGAQLEAGAFATSYIPTIASTVTRSADVATISGSLFSQWWNQSTGTFVFEGSILAAATAEHQSGFNVANGSFPVVLRFNDRFGAGMRYLNSDASLDIAVAPVLAANVVNKGATAYSGATDAALCRNGGAVGTDTSYNASAANTAVFLGSNSTGAGAFLNGHIRSIRYYPVRAADFQLQALTT